MASRDSSARKNLKLQGHSCYQRWLQNPLDPHKINELESELKDVLGLRASVSKDKTLASAFWHTYNSANELSATNKMMLQDAITRTLTLKNIPEYLPVVLDNLYTACPAQHKTAYTEYVINLAKQQPGLEHALLNSHPDLITAWVKENPGAYFELQKPVQNAVFRTLEQTSPATMGSLRKEAEKTTYIHKKQTILIPVEEMIDALTDTKTRQDLHNPQSQKVHQCLINYAEKEALAEIQHDNYLRSAQIILKYQSTHRNQFKKDFFTALNKDIEEKGLSVALLNEHLKNTDHQKLFKKWSGAKNSDAAKALAALYQIASDSKTLSEEHLTTMQAGKSVNLDEFDTEKYIATRVHTLLTQPEQAENSHFMLRVGNFLTKLQERAHFCSTQKQQKTLEVEASYQHYLIEKGLISANKSPPSFDPQGHVILLLQLNDLDYAEILKRLNQPQNSASGTAKKQFEAFLGTTVTDTVLCNLDIKNHPQLKNKFSAWLNNPKALNALMGSAIEDQRSSIIQLQEEMTLHVLLCQRVLSKNIPDFTYDNDQLLTSINQLVKTEFTKALALALPAGETKINYSMLNHELDKARKVLAPLCRSKLFEIMKQQCDAETLSEAIETLHKHDFTATTATGADYLHTNTRNQTVVRITATEHTAHDKKIGKEHQAFRVFYRNHYNAERNQVTPYVTKTIEARVPSIADKKARKNTAIADVADKLAQSHKELQQKSTYSACSMVYNLLTSLHTYAYDISPAESSNRQRLSAEYILHGAHQYNLRQLRAGADQSLVFIQNIPVNQHTSQLGDKAADKIIKEATLMADMALLSTFHHNAGCLSASLRQDIEKTYARAHTKYRLFLPQVENKETLFHHSRLGAETSELLKKHKQQWREVPIPATDKEPLDILVTKALFKMYAQNQHRDKQFGMMVQALSIFIEPMSQYGCKSANERFQGVSGRVELLKSMSARETLSPDEMAVKRALIELINNNSSAAILQQALDKAYNKYNLLGAAASVSMEDTGASSKVQATKNNKESGAVSEFNTNIAESGYLDRLHQSCSSSMQSHKANLVHKFKELLHKEKKEEDMQLTPRNTSSRDM